LLKVRYDNEGDIIQTHIKAIIELPIIAKKNARESFGK